MTDVISSYHWTTRFFPFKGSGSGWRGVDRIPCIRTSTTCSSVSDYNMAQLLHRSHQHLSRSRDWVCPHCQQSNAECLPDPPTGARPNAITSSEPAVPDAAFERSTSPPTPDAVSPIVTVSALSGPSRSRSNSLPPEQVSGKAPTDNHLTSSKGPSEPGISVPASLGGQRSGESGSSHGSVSAYRPAGIRTLDTVICVLLVLTFALFCRKIL